MVLPRFLAELKHRNVYRAAVVYAAVGWALLEAADVVLPRLGFPDWSVNVVLAVVLLCFPLALVFAWIFDISPQGVVRTEPIPPDAHRRLNLPAIVEFVLICMLVVTVVYLYVDRLSLQQRLVEPETASQETPAIAKPEQYRAIAVLPFADMSEAGDQAWFAEGIAEELLIALSQVDKLNVIARTSSFAFKNTDKTVAEIADILGVQAVLEGSVRRSGDRVRISAQLIDARTGYHIWSESFERQLTDIFTLQDELARGIVEALRVELGVDSARPLVAEQTRSMEAYNWFMRGRATFDGSSLQNTLLSTSYLEKAVEADTDYADAWGYLSYVLMMTMIARPFAEVGPQSIAAYERSLALDPGQSEALMAKALMTQLVAHDWRAADRIYQRGLASKDIHNALKRGYAFFYLQFLDRQAEANELYSNAIKRDPLNSGRLAILAYMFYFADDSQSAIRKAREALQLDPHHFIALHCLILAYAKTNDIAALDSLLARIPPALQVQQQIRVTVGLSHAVLGNEEEARNIYEELLGSIHSLIPFTLLNTAMLALDLGEIEQGIDLLERLEKSGSWVQFWSKLLADFYEPLREHPRYQALLRRIGLDDESVASLQERMSFN